MRASDFNPGDAVRSRVNGIVGRVIRASNKLDAVEVEWHMRKRRAGERTAPAIVPAALLAHVRGSQRRVPEQGLKKGSD